MNTKTLLRTMEIAHKEAIFQTIKQIIRSELVLYMFEINEFSENTRFKELSDYDSLANIIIHLEFERVFQISIPDKDYTAFVTVNDVINYVEKRLNEKKADL